MGKNSTSGEKTQQAGDEKTKEEVKSEDQRLCELSSDGFIKRLKIANILHNSGALKEKGVPAIEIFTYMFNQMFSPLSMYSQMKLGIFHEGFSKNTVYRFLEEACMNWHKAVLLLANSIIQVVALLTSGSSGRFALVIDDTPLKKRGRKMDLESAESGRQGILIRGGFLELTGSNIMLSGKDPSVDLYFVSEDDPSRTVMLGEKKMGINSPSKLACVVPATLSDGTYRLRVVTQFTHSKLPCKEPRSFIYDQPLEVASA